MRATGESLCRMEATTDGSNYRRRKHVVRSFAECVSPESLCALAESDDVVPAPEDQRRPCNTAHCGQLMTSHARLTAAGPPTYDFVHMLLLLTMTTNWWRSHNYRAVFKGAGVIGFNPQMLGNYFSCQINQTAICIAHKRLKMLPWNAFWEPKCVKMCLRKGLRPGSHSLAGFKEGKGVGKGVRK